MLRGFGSVRGHKDVGVERVTVRLLEGRVEQLEGAGGGEEAWAEEADGRQGRREQRTRADGEEEIPHSEGRLRGERLRV